MAMEKGGGLISRVLSFDESKGQSFIWGFCYQKPRATYPSNDAENTFNVAPIWSCSRWGLSCHSCCQECGALLPHRFTLTLFKSFLEKGAVYFL